MRGDAASDDARCRGSHRRRAGIVRASHKARLIKGSTRATAGSIESSPRRFHPGMPSHHSKRNSPMNPCTHRFAAVLALAALCPTALAQFDNQWASFANATNSRIHNPDGSVATQITSNNDEKHFAYGDFNNDGW